MNKPNEFTFTGTLSSSNPQQIADAIFTEAARIAGSDGPENAQALEPRPTLVLMLKILQFIESEKEKSLASGGPPHRHMHDSSYHDEVVALEAAAVLLRAVGDESPRRFSFRLNPEASGGSR